MLTEVAVHREGDEARTRTRWYSVKRVALMIGLVIAFLQYYMMDTLLQIVSVKQVPIFLPVTSLEVRSALEDLSAPAAARLS